MDGELWALLIPIVNADNEAFLHAGGSLEDSERATAQIAVAESYLESRVNGPNFPSTTGAPADGALPISYGYVVAEAGEKGLGAFAIQDFHRGDLILTDPPLFLVDEPNHSRIVTLRNIMIAVQKLSHAEKRAFVSLKNAHSGSKLVDNPIIGIYYTNAFEAGNRSAICVAASRFNHSCLPNARYSWHAASGRMRIYALREIAIGEEIFVSYLSGRRVYGSCHKDRQKELKRYIFTCACIACSLPSLEQAASDARRKEIARIWDSVPLYMPHQTADRLTAIIRAIRLLEEEGYPADADDFTNDAAAICACHGDWESVRYWATKTYETRVAEFGEDSHRAAEVKNSYLDLKKSPHAETQRKQIFTARL